MDNTEAFLTAHQRIYQQLMMLMEEKPFDRITVKEVCQRAETSRNTFYKHYKDLKDVLYIHIEEGYEGYYRKAEKIKKITSYEASFLAFQSIESDREFFKAVIKAGMGDMLEHYIRSFIKHFFTYYELGRGLDKLEREIYINYRAAGVSSMIKTWVITDFKTSAHFQARLAGKFESFQ